MIIRYKGNQAAMRISLGGSLIRLNPNTSKLLTEAQYNELAKRASTKQMLQAKLIEFVAIDKLEKDELVALAHAGGHKVDGKEKVSDLIALLEGKKQA